ncbi:hypothetical protein AB0F03_07305 [Streptomyces sp. NPDC028722]|uniref:hypothetical protein n=1 Tax=Streptomyces sp. NPDC028722 TaxID=3155016 RepID=UPI0033E433F5
MTERTQAERPGVGPAAQRGVEPEARPGVEPEAGPAAAGVPALPGSAPRLPGPGPGPQEGRGLVRGVLRWTAGVAVCALVASGTAYGITRADRTDLPGLATLSDGRWDYPDLVRPPLPAGSPGPLAAANRTGTHYADLRALLLPAPEGATPDPAPRGAGGWQTTKDFLAPYTGADNRRELGQTLTDYGLRHIAARGWTTPDGTRTRIELLQFDSAVVADDLLNDHLVRAAEPAYLVRGTDHDELDVTFPAKAQMGGEVTLVPYAEMKPYGAEQVRQAYLAAGDTVAIITQARKGGADAVPFRQTVTLQTELLT